MSEPTICVNCKHYRPHPSYMECGTCSTCAAAYTEGFDYITGAPTLVVKPGDYEWCSIRNNGRCADYEAKQREGVAS